MKSSLSSIFASIILLASMNIQAALVQLDVRDGILFGASNVNVLGKLYDVSFQDGQFLQVYRGLPGVPTGKFDPGIVLHPSDPEPDWVSPEQFVFLDEESALAAGQALLSQVFVDSALGLFDSNGGLSSGCAEGGIICDLIIPYVFRPGYVRCATNSGGNCRRTGPFTVTDPTTRVGATGQAIRMRNASAEEDDGLTDSRSIGNATFTLNNDGFGCSVGGNCAPNTLDSSYAIWSVSQVPAPPILVLILSGFFALFIRSRLRKA